MIYSAKNSAIPKVPGKFRGYIPFGILTAVYLALFHGTLAKLVTDWGQDSNFSHGYLVPIISGYMAWHRRNDWLGQESEPGNWGLVILLLGGLLHVAGNAGAELFTMRFSMVLTLWGTFLYMKGWKISRTLFFPVLYLLFMIPIPAVLWNGIAFPLQLWASQVTAKILEVIGISVLREGNVLHLPTTTLEVVEACSGIRSLTSLMALSAAFAYFVSLRKTSKGILFLSAIPIALVVNILRLTVTAASEQWTGLRMTEGFIHELSGLMVFGTALILLAGIYVFLARLEKEKPATPGPSAP